MNLYQSSRSALLLMFLLSNVHCKKKKLNQPLPEEPKVETRSQKVYVPVKFESKTLTIMLGYQDQTALLTSVENSNKKKAALSYKNEMPFKIRYYDQEKATGFLDFQANNKKVINVNSWKEELKVNISTGNYTYSYDSQNRIAEVHYYGPDHVLSEQSTFSYDPENNLSKINTQEFSQNTGRGFTYHYDTKNGIFKDVAFFWVLFKELGYDFFYPTKNNPVSAEGTGLKSEHITYNYRYNEQNYPSELTITRNNIAEVYKITYQELSQ